MAMQQSSKGASGSGPNPALSDEQADQFAASFTPSWDTGEDDAPVGAAEQPVAAIAEAAPPAAAPAAPAVVASPAVILSPKATMIGVAPPTGLEAAVQAANQAPIRAAVSSAELIEPENVLEVITAPPANAAPAPAPQVNLAMRTQVMANRPGSVPPPTRNGAVRSDAPAARVAIASDPFQARPRAASSTDDLDLVPKRSSKALLVVVGGLVVAAGVGLLLKFGMTDDSAKTPPTQVVTGPAVTTAEIPPPPPKVENAPPSTTTAVAVAKPPDPPPPPLATPPSRAAEPQAPRVAAAPAAPRNEPRAPRGAALPPPQPAAAAPPPPPASPKTPPKPPNGGIVRDNPF